MPVTHLYQPMSRQTMPVTHLYQPMSRQTVLRGGGRWSVKQVVGAFDEREEELSASEQEEVLDEVQVGQ